MTDFTEAIIKFLTENHAEYTEKDRYFVVRCLNPLHDDKHPSMIIYKNSGTGICSSCNHRVQIRDDKVRNVNYSRNRLKYNFTENKTVYHEVSLNLPPAFSVLENGFPEYKVTPTMAKELNIGICKNGYSTKPNKDICDKCSFNNFYYKDSGSCFFAKQRMMTPIIHNGELYSLESRDLTRKSKKKILYPNNSQAHNTIYNFNKLNTNEILYVVEGIKSCMALYMHVSKNSTAIFSNRIKGQQRILLKQFKKIVLIPDHGIAGDITVEDFQRLDIPELWVLRLPKMGICKNCKSKYRDSQLKVCPKCESSDIGYTDLFDIDEKVVKNLINTKVLKVESSSLNKSMLDDLVLDR